MKADIVILLPPPQACLDDPDAYYKIGEKRKQVISVHMAVSVTEYVGECYRNHKTREVICSEFPDGTGHLEVNYDESVEAFAAFLHSHPPERYYSDASIVVRTCHHTSTLFSAPIRSYGQIPVTVYVFLWLAKVLVLFRLRMSQTF
jgi:hypothetical protein